MDNHKLKILIDKYLAGTATAAEIFIVETWLASFQLDHDDTSELETNDNSRILARKIIDQAFGNTEPETPERHLGIIPLWKVLGNIAVALAVISVLAWMFFKQDIAGTRSLSTRYIAYKTGINQLKELMLPDSTIVYLNANSSLEVQQDFTKQTERRVKLIGEAFFDVKKDANHPFKIQVNDLQVKVLGTSFNISGHVQLSEIKVSVKTGQVQVNDQHHVLAALKANEELVFNRKKKTWQTLQQESAGQALWRSGVSVLDKASFDEISLAMFNIYGITLNTTDKEVLTERYNFTIRSSRTLQQSLNQLCELMNKGYRKEGNSIVIY